MKRQNSKAVNMTLGKFALGLAVVFFSTAFGLEAFEDKKPEAGDIVGIWKPSEGTAYVKIFKGF